MNEFFWAVYLTLAHLFAEDGDHKADVEELGAADSVPARVAGRHLLKVGVPFPINMTITVGPPDTEDNQTHEETIICTPPGE